MTSYTYYYPGGNYGLDSPSVSTGYPLPSSQLGTSLRPDTAAQVVEVSNLLNQGFKQLEPGALSTEIFDQIPKQHFEEIRRLGKLADTKMSFHAPIQGIEASGIQEGKFSELNREITERKLQEVIDKAHTLSPDKSIPVTIHSANMAGTEFIPGDEKERFKPYQIVAVNRETGEVKTAFKEEERAYPSEIAETGKPIKKSPEQQLNTVNESQWVQAVNQLFGYQKNVDEVLGDSLSNFAKIIQAEEQGIPTQQALEQAGIRQQDISRLDKADVFINNLQSSFGSEFDKAYKYSDEETKKTLKKIAENWTKGIEKMNETAIKEGLVKPVKNKEGKFYLMPLEGKQLSYKVHTVLKSKEILENSLNKLRSVNPPQTFQKVEDFAMDNSAKTFANVAMHSYEKYGKKDPSKAPMVSIENLYSGMAYSKPEDFKKLIDKSRENFKKQLMKKQNVSEKKANKIANQIIGVTWDVGHLNMLKKQGFEDKDLVEATKKVGKDVKHVHLTDNFGYGDSHLVPGMGNVPFKKHLEELEKQGVLNKETMFINEIQGFVNQFRKSPFPYLLESFNSPVMATGEGPYWSQASNSGGNYMQFPSAMLPEQHFSMYGGGFSTLPRELGGQGGGGNASRFSNTPNA